MDGLACTRHALQRQRAAGVPFARAWQAALAELEPGCRGSEAADEFAALLATEPSWRAAYTGTASPTSEHAVERPPDAPDSMPHVTVYLPS